MPDASRYGYPPRVLRCAEAARYTGRSETAFRDQVAPAVPAVTLRGIKGWLREDLDAWIDREAGRGVGSAEVNPWHAP